ncbi:MAG: hypothetical protein JKX76_02770 [Colwellia sp.]|nr:hypothetical protein [Colwellia sp.]
MTTITTITTADSTTVPRDIDMREMFEEARLSADLDVPHFMRQFPTDSAGRIVGSPWGPWFLQWCEKNECRRHKTLLQYAGHVAEKFSSQHVTQALMASDMVLARYLMRTSEDHAQIWEYLIDDSVYVGDMSNDRARAVLDFLLEEWLYAGILSSDLAPVKEFRHKKKLVTAPEARSVPGCASDFWAAHFKMTETERKGYFRFQPEMRLVFGVGFLMSWRENADEVPSHSGLGTSIERAISTEQSHILEMVMQHDSIASLTDGEVTKQLFDGFSWYGSGYVIPYDDLARILRAVYAARPASLLALARMLGGHYTVGFYNWMVAHSSMARDELAIMFINTHLAHEKRSYEDSRAVMALYRHLRADLAGHGVESSEMGPTMGLVAVHEVLATADNYTDYESMKCCGFPLLPGLVENEMSMTLDELRERRGADFETSLAMRFWMQPITEAESAWLKLFRVKTEGAPTLCVAGGVRYWHAYGSRIKCVSELRTDTLTELGTCPTRIISLFLVRDFRYKFRYMDKFSLSPAIMRLHELGLISEKDQAGLAGLLTMASTNFF